MMRRALALLLFWAASSGAIAAAERILSYHSDIDVFPDASISVRETIRVRAERKQIKRGIYRDFPLEYQDRLGNRHRVGFELVEVLLDGKKEPYHTTRQRNGIRIYVGEKHVLLDPGEYTYTLTYRSERQLGFFENHDELYWNVTGNDWVFPIDKVSAAVLLPTAVPDGVAKIEAYTGLRGDKGQDYQAAVNEIGVAEFHTTRALSPHEGLTIVVAWPKGYVQELTTADKAGYLLADNRHIAVGAGGATLLLAYFWWAWLRVGRDPPGGVIIPLYRPPRGYSPASMRFILRQGYDHKAFSAAIVNLAVKGRLKIEEMDKKFMLHKREGERSDMAPGEAALMDKLFDGAGLIALDDVNHRIVRAALNAHKASLERDYEKIYFLNNKSWLLPGIVIAVATLIVSVMQIPNVADAAGGMFMMIWLTFWTIGLFFLLAKCWRAWQAKKWASAIVLGLMTIMLLVAEGFVVASVREQLSLGMAILAIALAGLCALFYYLLKAPTRAGRRLLDKVEGFRLYLDVAEKDELNLRNSPDKTPELFEAYLPFALALGVEQRWADRFAAVLSAAGTDGKAYSPEWYHGSGWRGGMGAGSMAAGLGSSLGAAVAASASPPGSSSGMGGGGSSGGGGGGGGGGGW